MREYVWRGSTYQFEDGQAPEGAVPVGEPVVTKEAPKPANKARAARSKGVKR